MPLVGSISIENSLDRHHGCLPNPPVRFLFLDHPIGCFPCQPLPICIHELPGTVKKTPDNLNRARVKAFVCGSLCDLEFTFINLPVLAFAPTPIL